jgi:hypothetical protein
MEIMTILLLLSTLLIIDAGAWRWGADSRDGLDRSEREPRRGWPPLAGHTATPPDRS